MWQHVAKKHTHSLSLSLNLSRFIPISLELIQIHLNSSEPPDLSRFIKIYYDSSLIHPESRIHHGSPWSILTLPVGEKATTSTAPSDATRKATKWPKGPCPSPQFFPQILVKMGGIMWNLSIHLSVYLSIYLFIYLSIYLSIYRRLDY